MKGISSNFVHEIQTNGNFLAELGCNTVIINTPQPLCALDRENQELSGALIIT